MRDFSAVEARVSRAALRNFNNRAIIAVGGVTITQGGIFDARYLDVLEADTAGPAVKVATAEVPHAVQNMAVIVNGIEAYKIVSIQPDGVGITTLRLHKA